VRQALPFFSKHLLERGIIEGEIRDQLFEPAMFVRSLLEPAGLADFQTTICGLPTMVGRFAHPMRAACVEHLLPSLHTFEDANNLCFRKPALLHDEFSFVLF
jgi:hypothetical protein